MFWSSSPTAMSRMSSLFCIRARTNSNSFASISCASSITRTLFVILPCSTSPLRISSAAFFTTSSTPSKLPILPSRSKQYEWKVLISTKFAALPISERRRFLNSVAAARENVSIKSCSCFTSSSNSNAASLWTSTRVFPLPGPAATTIYFESASLMICA